MTVYDVQESATIAVDESVATGKRWNAVLIKAGWGSKAYYTEEALKRDGAMVFPAGTPVFLDHQTPEERELKPFGSVTNLAGELATDAVWDEEQQGLTAEIEIFDHEQARVKSIAKRVGLSIRARTTAERGTMEGRSGRIVTGLVGAKSVDLVVRAGAGGGFLDVLESDVDIEMEEQQMDEVLKALAGLSERFDKVDTRLTDIEESLVAEVVEVEVPEAAVVEEIDLAALVAAEVAKLNLAPAPTAVQESADDEGTEENADDVEESATEIKLPSRWAVKGNN
jgi:hypothetical protein